MTPEQFDRFLESNERATGEAVQKFVNGKIDKMNEKLDAHIEKHDSFLKEVMPVLQMYQGGKFFGEGLKWIAGVGLAIAAIMGWLHK